MILCYFTFTFALDGCEFGNFNDVIQLYKNEIHPKICKHVLSEVNYQDEWKDDSGDFSIG